MVNIEAYFDGSFTAGTMAASAAVSLAGVGTNATLWREIQSKWVELLSNRAPSAKYLHMREACHLRGEFDRRKGWDDQKVSTLVVDGLKYLQTLDKQRFRIFAITLDLTDWRKVRAMGHPVESEVAICNEWCPKYVLAWYMNNYPGVRERLLELQFDGLGAEFFFDQGEPFRVPFEKRWREWLTQQEDPGMRMLWGLIKKIEPRDMKITAGLQIADLVAWTKSRELAGMDRKYRHMAHIMRQILPSSTGTWREADLQRMFPVVQ